MSSPADTTDNTLFEAIFQRAHKASSSLAAAMKAKGYDLQSPRPRYPSQVLLDCLLLARAEFYPAMPEPAGLRALGQSFVGGFRQTILGTVMTAALPILGPKTMLGKVPGRLERVRQDMKCALETKSATSYVIVVRDPVPLGDFFAGVLEAALGVAGAKGAQVVKAPRPDGYALEVTLKG